jgi:hypothetical protein
MPHDSGEIRAYLRTKRLQIAVGALSLASLAIATQVAPFPTLTMLNIVILVAILLAFSPPAMRSGIFVARARGAFTACSLPFSAC